MKTNKQLLLTAVVFGSLLGIAFLLQATAPQPITVNVQLEPDTMDLGAPGWTVKTVIVTLWFDRGKYDGRDIDPKTVLIEDILEPKGGWKHTWTERIRIGGGRNRAVRWVFRFEVSGSSLRELLWTMITHMSIPGPVAEIPLTVTGFLDTGDGFSGTATITVYIPTVVPPQPLP